MISYSLKGGSLMNSVADVDLDFLRRSFKIAEKARARGDHPFGAILVYHGEVLLEQGNVVETGRDLTGHAEITLVRVASSSLERAVLTESCLYSSAEPCAMCSGAIYWAGIGRLVYGLSEYRLRRVTGSDERNLTLDVPCRDIFAKGRSRIEVVGPMLEDEAEEVHRGFWESRL